MVPTTIIAFTLNIQMDMVEMYMEGKKMDMKKEEKKRFTVQLGKGEKREEKPRFLGTNVFTF